MTTTVKGDLLLHRVRVELSAPIRVLFHDPDRAAAHKSPDLLKVETLRLISGLLKVHEVKPRNSASINIAEETKLFGAKVGTEAKVSFSLGATAKGGP